MLDLRDRFFVPDPPTIELRAFTHGLMPRTVPAMLEAFTRDWKERGVDAWNQIPNYWTDDRTSIGWWTLPDFLGDHFIAPLIGAPFGTCIHQPNVHWSVQALLSCNGPFEGRDEIVLGSDEFPSVRHSVRRWTELRDIAYTESPTTSDGWLDVEKLVKSITDRTAWVFVSHVGFTSGEKLTDDVLREIADAAHEHGALLAVDGYHATGSCDINVEAIGTDVYFGGLVKEGCGSAGNTYLYVRDGLNLQPILSGWFGDGDPFGFRDEPTIHPDVRRRFLGSTVSVATMYHSVEGVRILLEQGLDAIRADSLKKTELAIRRAESAGLTLRSPREAERRSAMVILEVEAADRLCEWLKTQNVYTDSRRGEVLRMAPFVWNTREEIDRAFDVIERALETGAHLEAEVSAQGGPVT